MTRVHKIGLFAALAITAVATACSLVVNTDKDQCATDYDCHATEGAVCSDGVCVLVGAVPDSGSSEAGPVDAQADCEPKVPVTQSDFLNETCTIAQCIDFDNCARLGLCGDAALPDLVAPPEGGVSP